jgi:hypothetical protein
MSKQTGWWLVIAALVFGSALPIGAYAAGSLVEISSASGRKASVSRANQLYVAESSPELHRRALNYVLESRGCVLILAAPAGRALILESASYNTYSNPTPGTGNFINLYVGSSCTTVVDQVTPGVGPYQTLFEPGLPVPAGQGVYARAFGGVSANVFIAGYLVPSEAVPTSGISGAPAPYEGP